MTRNESPGTQDHNSWKIDVGAGGKVVADHPSGSTVIAELVLGQKDGRGGLRVNMYRHFMSEGFVSDGPEAPIEWIEDRANEPGMFALILDRLQDVDPADKEVIPMRLPAAMLARRDRPDSFYQRVAALVKICKEHGIAYGPRIAKDNDVSENTVRYWIHEARKRGFLDGGAK